MTRKGNKGRKVERENEKMEKEENIGKNRMNK